MVDCVYVAACARDARLTRICVASIRYFYPDVPIRLLAGDTLQRGLAEELRKYWGVELVNFPPGDYGWGFVKLEPLFGPAGERFLVMDADTVFTGRVLDVRAESDAPFLGDDEHLSDADFKRLYYDWDKVREIDPTVQPARKALNGGQWFGTAGLVTREEFDPWIEWSLPRRQRYPEYFMGGEQGVMNCVILKKEAVQGLRIDRRTLMRWPGNSMDGLDAESVSSGDRAAAGGPLGRHEDEAAAKRRWGRSTGLLREVLLRTSPRRRRPAGSRELLPSLASVEAFLRGAAPARLSQVDGSAVVETHGRRETVLADMKALIKRALAGLGYRIQGTRYTPRQLLEPRHLRAIELADVIYRRMFEFGQELTFIQIGAFDGMTADPLHKYVGKYGWRGVLVEPQPRSADQLRELYRGNDRIVVVQAAVDQERRQRTLFTVESESARPGPAAWRPFSASTSPNMRTSFPDWRR